MYTYIQDAIYALGELITWTVSTPTARELFDEDQVTLMLDVERGGKFRSVVIKYNG